VNAKSKAFAFISIALMIGGAFVCCSMFNDNSSADQSVTMYQGVSKTWTTPKVAEMPEWSFRSEPYGHYKSGGVSSFNDSEITVSIGGDYYNYSVTLTLKNSLSPGTYKFSFWDMNGNAEPEEGFDLTITLLTSNYTVSFNSMGGSYVAPQSVSPGGYATAPANPTNGVNVFGGWYTDQACTQAFNFSTPINSDIILFAKWSVPTASVTSSHGNSSMTVGQLFSYNVSTNPGNATVTVSGADWLHVSGYTVYGTPTTPGTYNVTITSSASGYSNGSQSFTITVSSILAPGNTPSNGVIAYVR